MLPTTLPATLLIAYEGPAPIDPRLDAVHKAVLSRRLGLPDGAAA